MGKSTTARLFAEEGCAVWDADAAVHRLYSRGGAAVAPIAATFPEVVEEGEVSRERLKTLISENPETLKRIEQIVHPLVAEDRSEFLRRTMADIAVFDIPLLFEGGGADSMDAIVCVSAPPEIQRERVLARRDMTETQFDLIRSKQMPDEEKRKRSDYVIVTDTIEHAREQVQAVIKDIREKTPHA